METLVPVYAREYLFSSFSRERERETERERERESMCVCVRERERLLAFVVNTRIVCVCT